LQGQGIIHLFCCHSGRKDTPGILVARCHALSKYLRNAMQQAGVEKRPKGAQMDRKGQMEVSDGLALTKKAFDSKR
jgi:hypothetical protein